MKNTYQGRVIQKEGYVVFFCTMGSLSLNNLLYTSWRYKREELEVSKYKEMMQRGKY